MTITDPESWQQSRAWEKRCACEFSASTVNGWYSNTRPAGTSSSVDCAVCTGRRNTSDLHPDEHDGCRKSVAERDPSMRICLRTFRVRRKREVIQRAVGKAGFPGVNMSGRTPKTSSRCDLSDLIPNKHVNLRNSTVAWEPTMSEPEENGKPP